jgi:hypothetical protein
MNYHIFGGFEIPLKRHQNAVADPRDCQEFWWDVHGSQNLLCYALGCYVFAMRWRGRILPWYVGKAYKRGFIDECFAPHKRLHYNDVLSDHRGTPLLFLVARMTPGGKFSKAIPETEARHMEINLIRFALRRNPALKNVSHAKFLQRLKIGHRTGASRKEIDDFTALFKS